MPTSERMVIFFGTDFYNLPIDSNRENYIIATNKMLSYIRKHFSGFRLIYQAHPNEKDELGHLDLSGFTIGEKKVAEVLLYDNAARIEYVFSTCSWANGSAYAMGINSAVFLDLLKGCISDESILAYHSYFEGLPEEFFITSFDQEPPRQRHDNSLREKDGFEKIKGAIGDSKKIWVLATDPALALRGAIICKELKETSPETKTGLLLISGRRWENVKEGRKLFDVFDEVVEMSHKKVWYSMRLPRIWNAIKVSFKMRKLPIKEGDTVISFSNLLFEENCILSYFKRIKKILMIESRWYFFVYEEQYRQLDPNAFNTFWGIRFFNFVLEPLLGLHRTIFKEFRDGKVINIFRYRKPLQETYDQTFVLMPDKIK
ncbi:MAG TPA: hypothetical protein VEC13_01205 [Candidatus Paceibacterota bacterium]|nr:hypothetical protein [Candidatus Paceibacterota bacterium]